MDSSVTGRFRPDSSSIRQQSLSPESENEHYYDAEEEFGHPSPRASKMRTPPKRGQGRQKMPGMCNAVGETPPLFNHRNLANGFTEAELAQVVWKGPPLPGYGPRIEMPINQVREPEGPTRGGVALAQVHDQYYRYMHEFSAPPIPLSEHRPRYIRVSELHEQSPRLSEPVPVRPRPPLWTAEDLWRARARLDPALLAEMDHLDEEEELYPPEEELEDISHNKPAPGKGKGRGGARGPGSRGGKVKGAGGRGVRSPFFLGKFSKLTASDRQIQLQLKFPNPRGKVKRRRSPKYHPSLGSARKPFCLLKLSKLNLPRSAQRNWASSCLRR